MWLLGKQQHSFLSILSIKCGNWFYWADRAERAERAESKECPLSAISSPTNLDMYSVVSNSLIFSAATLFTD
jgi:hypothetical protein